MKPKILIVEDEPAITDTIQYALETDGFETVTLSSGMSVIPLIAENPVDLIVLDIRMPKMDGLEAIGNIIDINKNIPIIINSAYSNYKDDFMSWAADAYVVKSYNLDELKTTIKEVLLKKKSPS